MTATTRTERQPLFQPSDQSSAIVSEPKLPAISKVDRADFGKVSKVDLNAWAMPWRTIDQVELAAAESVDFGRTRRSTRPEVTSRWLPSHLSSAVTTSSPYALKGPSCDPL